MWQNMTYTPKWLGLILALITVTYTQFFTATTAQLPKKTLIKRTDFCASGLVNG